MYVSKEGEGIFCTTPDHTPHQDKCYFNSFFKLCKFFSDIDFWNGWIVVVINRVELVQVFGDIHRVASCSITLSFYYRRLQIWKRINLADIWPIFPKFGIFLSTGTCNFRSGNPWTHTLKQSWLLSLSLANWNYFVNKQNIPLYSNQFVC